jgi:hypothetical protein
METADVIKVADTMLQIAKEKGGRVSTLHRQYIIKRAALQLPEGTVQIAGDLLFSEGMANYLNELGDMRATALGIATAGQLEQFLADRVEEERIGLEASKATVRSATIMEEQLAQAKADAQRSHNAMVVSIIAACIAALAAVLTWLFPRH